MAQLLWNVSDDLSICQWHSSLTSVLELVNDTLKLPYILWNFVNYNGIERLTLADNPQFYGDLPASLTEYQSTCNILPVDIPGNFPDTNRMIHVLTNNANRVVLDHGKNWRTFDNVWRANDNTLILKSSCLAFPLFP